MEDQIFAHPVLPPIRGHVVIQSLVLLIYTWIASLFCHLLAFPAEKVWYHTVSVYPSDSPCIVYIVYLDAGSHEVAVHKTTASGCVSSMQMPRPHYRSCAVCRNASIPLVWQILTTSGFGICSCHLMWAIFRRQRIWNWSSLLMWWRYNRPRGTLIK